MPGSTYEVGARLVALCNEGKNVQAMEELYSDDIVSVEAVGDETMPREMSGMESIRGKTEWWYAAHDVHSQEAIGPFPNDDRFAVIIRADITQKESGQRLRLEEIGVYTVRNGKITREEFFYHTG